MKLLFVAKWVSQFRFYTYMFFFFVNAVRQWYFQTCTEFGYYQTANSDKSAFGRLVDIDFFVNVCKDVYGD